MSSSTKKTDTKNGANDTKNATTNFEDISTEVYPDRTGNYKSGNWGESYIKVRCQTKIAKAIESSKLKFVCDYNFVNLLFLSQTGPLVKLMMSALKSKGWYEMNK